MNEPDGHLGVYLFIYFCLLSSRAAPAAHGGSQTRGIIRAVATGLRQSLSNARSQPRLQPTRQLMGNTGSLTHWARPGIKPATSWFLVEFVSTAPRWELHFGGFFRWKLLCLERMDNGTLLYSTRKCVWLCHFAVQQNLMKHCKSTLIIIKNK